MSKLAVSFFEILIKYLKAKRKNIIQTYKSEALKSNKVRIKAKRQARCEAITCFFVVTYG